jgi:basic membrane lipoprotein Med (substrate-binding protein (PBP1-ABC) superfamily)
MQTEGGYNHYNEARTKGKKEYGKLKAKGESGHLTSLDGLLKDIEIVATVDLGVKEISLKKVVGTYYNARRMVFSKGFMPLESEMTEFGGKWIALCQSHLTEGIREPIIVYEYLNFYYVMEGNKRVSVLKYFDAHSVMAQIHRLVPKYDEQDEDIVLYYAFMNFYQVTGLSDIWLSKASRYEQLLSYLEGYEPESEVYASKYQHFYRYIYEPFRLMYLKVAEKGSYHTTGDAFLLYAKLYQITTPFDRNKAEKVMPNLVIELKNYGDDETIEIQTSSGTIPRQGLIGTLASILVPKKIKVGFVYARTIESSGWTYSHDLGRLHIETYFKDQVTTSYIDNVPEDDRAYQIISDFAQEGYDVIFSTSEIFRRVTLRCAIENPTVKFFNCSGNRPYVHMSNYFGRTYEPRFLAGIIAGAMTKTQIIGYTATDKSPEVTACINAFAMGMKMVNPRAKLLVALTGEWNNPSVTTDISEELIELGADIVSNKNILTPREVTNKYGVYAMLCDIDQATKLPLHYLAAPIWVWGTFYQKIIESILNGSYQKLNAASADASRVINYWWGMESGVLDLYYAPEYIPVETVKLVEIMKKLIISDQFHPFSGPIYDQTGMLKVSDQATLSASEILEMDWYMDNVEIVDTERCYEL